MCVLAFLNKILACDNIGFPLETIFNNESKQEEFNYA